MTTYWSFCQSLIVDKILVENEIDSFQNFIFDEFPILEHLHVITEYNPGNSTPPVSI